MGATSLGSAGSLVFHGYNAGAAIKKGNTVELTLTAVALETIDQNKVPGIQLTATATKFVGVALTDIAPLAIGPVCFAGPCLALVDNTVAAGEAVAVDVTADVLVDSVGTTVGVALEAGPGSGTALALVFLNNIAAANLGFGGT